ncbi:MAG: hypothetical protein D6737_17425 [Chloroflexi bacterium]|nr:MAG: hypothetical protein CUN54_08100 [Phototrophicales bacterium]RMF77524.1 MAG: hypothetical protein D6737_17425 [Chloroflexota bacterium]
MTQISAAGNLTIDIQASRWRLLIANATRQEVLLEAVAGHAIRYVPVFATRRKLPESGVLYPDQIQRVMLGWSKKDASWHLGLVFEASLAQQRGSRWCELAAWPDKNGDVYRDLAEQAGQSLATNLSCRFNVVPPENVGGAATTTPPVASPQPRQTDYSRPADYQPTTTSPSYYDAPQPAQPASTSQYAPPSQQQPSYGDYSETTDAGAYTQQPAYPETTDAGVYTQQPAYPETTDAESYTQQPAYPETTDAGAYTQQPAYPETTDAGAYTQQPTYPETNDIGTYTEQSSYYTGRVPVAETRPLPALPVKMEMWTLQGDGSTQLELVRSGKWARNKLLRIAWYSLWAVVYVVLVAATFLSDIADPNPSFLPFLGIATAVIVIGLAFYNLYELITRPNRIIIDGASGTVRVMRGKSEKWRATRTDIESVYVTQVVNRKAVVQHGELNLQLAHVSGDEFYPLLLESQPKGKPTDVDLKVHRRPRKDEIQDLSLSGFYTDLQAVGGYIAAVLGVPGWYDRRVK